MSEEKEVFRRCQKTNNDGACGVGRGPSSIPLWEEVVPLSSKILDF